MRRPKPRRVQPGRTNIARTLADSVAGSSRRLSGGLATRIETVARLLAAADQPAAGLEQEEGAVGEEERVGLSDVANGALVCSSS